jgi:predicted phage gp36 major capsid-like protein
MNDDQKLLAIKLVEAERDEWRTKAIQRNLDIDTAKRENDALRDSLQSMVEYAEEHAEREDDQWGRYRQEKRDHIRAEIAKARGLLG